MCSGSLPTNSIFPIPPLIIPAPQLNKCHIWSLERAKKKKLLATWRPTGCGTGLNLIFLFFALGFQSFVYVTCEILAVISCFFKFFLRLFFCLCSMNYSHGYGPIVWMKVWLNYQPMTSYVIFIFLSCYLALAQMHGTLPYYLFSSWIIIIISVTF